MKINTKHVGELKVPIAILLVATLGGIGITTWTRTQIARDERALHTQESRMQEARNRYQRSGDERELILRFMGPFQELKGRGLIGPEQRINWLDALRTSNQQTQLFGADYQISTQQPYAFAQELNAPKLGLAQSLMKLRLTLAHEGELMRFIRLLESQNVGVFEINHCVLDRTSGSLGSPPRAQPNLGVECELAWITINPEPVERKP